MCSLQKVGYNLTVTTRRWSTRERNSTDTQQWKLKCQNVRCGTNREKQLIDWSLRIVHTRVHPQDISFCLLSRCQWVISIVSNRQIIWERHGHLIGWLRNAVKTLNLVVGNLTRVCIRKIHWISFEFEVLIWNVVYESRKKW